MANPSVEGVHVHVPTDPRPVEGRESEPDVGERAERVVHQLDRRTGIEVVAAGPDDQQGPKELIFTGLPTIAPNMLPKGALKDAVDGYYRAFRAAGIRPEVGQQTAWDAALLIVSALKKLGPDATAPQIREYLASLRGWTGVTGTFDFRAIPQRGVDWKSSVLVARWDPAKDTWVGVAPLGL